MRGLLVAAAALALCSPASGVQFVPKAWTLIEGAQDPMTVLKEVPGLPELTPGGPDRLAVVFSAPFGWSADASATSEAGLPLAYHGRTLQCAATLAARNLAGATPFDLYFVAPPEIIKRDGYPGWMKDLGVRVYPQDDLAVPVGAPDAVADHPLVRAAAWRLAAQQDAFIALGYRFLLQHGDDALVAKKIERNVVKTMADAKAVMGGFCRDCFHENWDMVRGVPELMRFALIAFDTYTPPGDVYNHTDPQSVLGLFSRRPLLASEEEDPQGKKGWDRTVLTGNWNLVDLFFWNATEVQVLVRMALDSKGIHTMRWTDSLVWTMVSQLYVADDAFKLTEPGEVVSYSRFGGLHPLCVEALRLSAEGSRGEQPDTAVYGPAEAPPDASLVDPQNQPNPEKLALAQQRVREHATYPLEAYGERQREAEAEREYAEAAAQGRLGAGAAAQAAADGGGGGGSGGAAEAVPGDQDGALDREGHVRLGWSFWNKTHFGRARGSHVALIHHHDGAGHVVTAEMMAGR